MNAKKKGKQKQRTQESSSHIGKKRRNDDGNDHTNTTAIAAHTSLEQNTVHTDKDEMINYTVCSSALQPSSS